MIDVCLDGQGFILEFEGEGLLSPSLCVLSTTLKSLKYSVKQFGDDLCLKVNSEMHLRKNS